MKKILLALAFIGCMFAAHAQEKPSTGDLYDGLTRPLTFNRVIPPYALEVTFSKTVHVIFPGHPLRRSGVFGSSGGESRRHGKRAACKGGPA